MINLCHKSIHILKLFSYIKPFLKSNLPNQSIHKHKTKHTGMHTNNSTHNYSKKSVTQTCIQHTTNIQHISYHMTTYYLYKTYIRHRSYHRTNNLQTIYHTPKKNTDVITRQLSLRPNHITPRNNTWPMIIKKDYFRNLDNTDLITSQIFILKNISRT